MTIAEASADPDTHARWMQEQAQRVRLKRADMTPEQKRADNKERHARKKAARMKRWGK